MEEFIGPYDPSKELSGKNSNTEKITIHVVQRTARTYITTIQGLQYHIDDVKEVLKKLRKQCNCNGCYYKETETIQLQGNQKIILIHILTTQYNVPRNSIILRGL